MTTDTLEWRLRAAEEAIYNLHCIVVALTSVFLAKAAADGPDSTNKLKSLLTSLLTESPDINDAQNESAHRFVMSMTEVIDDDHLLEKLMAKTSAYVDPQEQD